MHCDFENNYQALEANGSRDPGDCIQIKMFSHSIGPVHAKTILMLYITFLRGS
jgi:hypothetical protein